MIFAMRIDQRPAPPSILSSTYTEDNRNILVSRDESFVIELWSHPSTGYDWQVSFDEEKLSSSDPDFIEDDERSTGSGGIEKYTFRPLGIGETEIQFDYKRSWEDEVQRSLTFQVTVRE